ncbi:MAG: tRNA (guanosine(46)-N7)-methyltransferase TrmB [Verrucomicrobiota bacterium]
MSEPRTFPYEARVVYLDNLYDRLEWSSLFHNPHPVHLDLGAGDGGYTAAMAVKHPEINFLGVERLKGRAIKIAKKSLRFNAPNLKVMRLESAYTVRWLVKESSVEAMHLLFPDPWPKRKQQKFRLVQPEFVMDVLKGLKSGGYFHFATDHEEYFEAGCAVLSANPGFQRIDDSPWGELPQTDFERQWVAQGKKIGRSFWKKKG